LFIGVRVVKDLPEAPLEGGSLQSLTIPPRILLECVRQLRISDSIGSSTVTIEIWIE